MEDAGISEEDDDIDSQDSNTPIDHSYLAQNCSIKIITPTTKASVIYLIKRLCTDCSLHYNSYLNLLKFSKDFAISKETSLVLNFGAIFDKLIN